MNQVMRSARVEEDARLSALKAFGVLDTPPERGFDDIVHLARRLCAAPVALVSLVDRDRQWFKARAGFPPCETDLDSSVCKFVLTEPGVLQIPDLTRDPRTRANPLVTGEPRLRFYAGAPLRTPEGQVLGSLCVIDHVPRPAGLTPEQVEDLEALARQVMDQLLLRRSLADRGREERQRDAMAETLAAVVATGGDIGAAFDAVLDGAMRAVPSAEAGTVEIREGDELVYRAVTEALAPHLGLRLPLRGSLAGACFLGGAPLLVPDVLTDPRVKRDLVEALGLRSCLLVPVRRGGTSVGVLKLQSSRTDAFGEEDLRVLGNFAATVASGLAGAGEATAVRAAARTEYRRRAVFDSALDFAIILLDLDGNVTDWNSGASKILGWRPEEMLGKSADVFFTPEDREAGIPAMEMQAAMEKGRGIDERWHLRRSGERFWANGEMMALRDEDGAAIGFAKILRDRTEQKEGFARLQESQERYRLAARATNDAVWDWNLATNHILWNEALTTAYGHALEAVEPTGDWWMAQIHPDDRARVDASIHAVIDGTGTSWTEEYRFMREDGSYASVLDRGYVLRGKDGRATRMIGAMLDLTERKRAEDASRASERRLELERGLLRAILDQAPVGISVAGVTSEVPTLVNARAEAMLGHGVGEPGEARYEAYGAIHDDGRPYDPEDYPTVRVLRTGIPVPGEEMRYRNPRTGEVRRLEVSSRPVRTADGTVVAAVTALVDVEEILRAGQSLEESGARLRTVTDNVAQAVFQMDADGHIAFANPAAESMFGWKADEMLGRNLHRLLHHSHPDGSPYPEEDCPMRQALVHGHHVREAEDTFFHRDGTPVRVLVTNAPVRVDGAIASAVLTVSDVTEPRRAAARQAALLALGDRLRDLATIPEMTRAAAEVVGLTLGASRAGFGHVDADTGVLMLEPDWTAAGQASIAGTHRYQDYGDLLDGLRQGEPQVVTDVARDPRTAADIARWRSIGVGSLVNLPVRERGRLVAVYLVHDTRPRTWAAHELDFLQAVADRVEVGVSRLRAEERQELLNRELSHRMKNLLAMVQSIATQSMRNAADVETAKAVLSGRLIALSRAHDLLMGGALTSTEMEPVVRAALDPHTDHPGRFRLSGPSAAIGTDQALSLALMMHELATNAVKYGALSNADGFVTVDWTMTEGPNGTLLRLAWAERDGPPVEPPTRKGFGSRFIERGLVAQVDGALEFDYAPSGVTCTLTAALAEFQRGH